MPPQKSVKQDRCRILQAYIFANPRYLGLQINYYSAIKVVRLKQFFIIIVIISDQTCKIEVIVINFMPEIKKKT